MNIDNIPVIDSHCHFFNMEYMQINFSKLLSLSLEQWDDDILKETLFYKRAIRDLAIAYNVNIDEKVVLQTRETLCQQDYKSYVKMLFDKANIKGMIIDIGYKPAKVDLNDFKQFAPVEVKYVYRIETLIDDYWNKRWNFDDAREHFLTTLEKEVKNGVIAFKSIIGYRTGLDIDILSEEDARRLYNNNDDEKSFRDFFFNETIRICRKYNMPFQVHASFGESNVNLLKNNPLLLKRILDAEEFKEVKIILVHGGYPYSFEAGYLAAMYPNVYLDFSEMIPWITFDAKSAIKKVLDMAPFNKILFGSDGFICPELYYLGAYWGKKLFSEIIDELVSERILTETEGYELASKIFYKN
ncbi:MAG: uncharacterized protein PWQ82_1845, partial [Thermosediminibacterales bacterium]|nr:uncharacterized protein [Thermosediminibacterales bacterium]